MMSRQFHVLCLLAVGAAVSQVADAFVARRHLVEAREHFAAARPNFWPHARGSLPGQYGTTGHVAPEDLQAVLAWNWSHPDGRYHTTVAGGPVIDSDWNIYLTTNDGIRKFSPDGETLWHYVPPGDTNNQPMLVESTVFGNTNNGYAFALDTATGQPLWVQKHGETAGPDVGYPAAHNGIYVMGMDMGHGIITGGNERVLGLNATTGSQVWEFRTDHPVWNLMPVFPDDDTVVFMDFTGGVYRLALSSGALMWHTPVPDSAGSFTDGGVILGINGMAYTCSNPGTATGSEGTPGVLRAFRLSDGAMVWYQVLPQPCNSWPAVGKVSGDAGLSVVATVGSFPGLPSDQTWLPRHAGIMVFDAATGEPQWQFRAPVWDHPAAKGDAEGVQDRVKYDPAHPICLPASWSAPTISGDGTIYVGHLDGKLYAVRGPPRSGFSSSPAPLQVLDFPTSAQVVAHTFDAEGAFLHGGTAWADGMMATSTCDTLWVFRYAER